MVWLRNGARRHDGRHFSERWAVNKSLNEKSPALGGARVRSVARMRAAKFEELEVATIALWGCDYIAHQLYRVVSTQQSQRNFLLIPMCPAQIENDGGYHAEKHNGTHSRACPWHRIGGPGR